MHSRCSSSFIRLIDNLCTLFGVRRSSKSFCPNSHFVHITRFRWKFPRIFLLSIGYKKSGECKASVSHCRYTAWRAHWVELYWARFQVSQCRPPMCSASGIRNMSREAGVRKADLCKGETGEFYHLQAFLESFVSILGVRAQYRLYVMLHPFSFLSSERCFDEISFSLMPNTYFQ